MLSKKPRKSFHCRLEDPVLDSWKGAAMWARNAPMDAYLNKKAYLECGHGYLKEHQCSNVYRIPSKIAPKSK